MLKNRRDIGIHPMGELATRPSARRLRRVAVLQLLVIAGYYSSLRLAAHGIRRPLNHVQLLFLG